MRYVLDSAVPPRATVPTTPNPEAEDARLREQVHAIGVRAMKHHLLRRLYRIHRQGDEALMSLIEHFGWPRLTDGEIDGETLSDDERDALEELLLLTFTPRYPLMPRGELVLRLFALLCDTPRFSATRLGKKCVGVAGYQICTQILRDRQCSEAEINLLLAVWLRDRMCARGRVRNTAAGLRFYSRDRAAMAERLGMSR